MKTQKVKSSVPTTAVQSARSIRDLALSLGIASPPFEEGHIWINYDQEISSHSYPAFWLRGGNLIQILQKSPHSEGESYFRYLCYQDEYNSTDYHNLRNNFNIFYYASSIKEATRLYKKDFGVDLVLYKSLRGLITVIPKEVRAGMW